MSAARIRTGSRLERLAFLLAVISLVGAGGGDGTLAQRAAADSPRPVELAQGSVPPVRDLKFAHLTTNDGLSQDRVFAIMQDRLGFMWLSTGEGLNRYDGHSFVVYKNDPRDSGSLSDNGTGDVFEDTQGFLWVAAYPGINKFDPRTERVPIRSRPSESQQLRQPFGVEHRRR